MPTPSDAIEIARLRDWRVLLVGDDYMVQHIPSEHYLGGKAIATSSPDINNKKNWRYKEKEFAMNSLRFIAK